MINKKQLRLLIIMLKSMEESEHILRSSIDMHGTISDDYPECEPILGFKNMFLKRHQLQTVQAMLDLEKQKQVVGEHEYLISEIGILGNKVGSGKSFCVLGLILKSCRLQKQPFLKQPFGNFAYIMNDRSYMEIKGGNLLVVPNHIIKSVWERYIVENTNLSYIVISPNILGEWDKLSEYDIVICGASYYNILMKTCPWTWSRVIIDEADTIKLPACQKPHARFVWFVSSSTTNMLFASGGYIQYDKVNGTPTKVFCRGIVNNGYIKNTFKTLESRNANPILNLIIIKLNDKYVDRYLNLPKIYNYNKICYNPYHLRILDGTISDNVIRCLNGYDNDSALEAMGCPVDTKENLISYVCRTSIIQRQNLVHKLEYLKKVESVSVETKNKMNQKFKEIQEKIREIDKKVLQIRKRINELDQVDETEHYCPICLNTTPGEMCMLSCCLNMYCVNCVKKLLQHHIIECPLCRCNITIDKILKPVQSNNNITNDTKNDKLLSVLKDIILNDESVIIFTLYDNTLLSINGILDKLHYKHRTLCGNNSAINKTIKLFEEETIKIIVANASTYGCGLNLTKADNIIIYQEMDTSLKMQIIGRSYRMGRSNELKIYNLLHENEYDNVVNKRSAI